MQNEWTDLAKYKAAVRAEIEAEFLDKLEKERIHFLEWGAQYEDHVRQERAELGDYEEKLKKLEIELYEEYNKKLAAVRTYIIDKVDVYLDRQWTLLCRAGEDKAAALLEKWREAVPAAAMVEEAIGPAPPLSLRQLEARCMRIETENARLTECIKQLTELLCTARKDKGTQ